MGPNYKVLTTELKKILKIKKIKYAHLAEQMGMSESSVKRLMSADDAPLSKIESLCEIAGISFFDLVDLCKEEKLEFYRLTKEQAKYFAHNPHYFEFFTLLYEQRKTVSQIKENFGLTKKSVMLYLKKLEELKLLERHPHDKVVFLIKGSIDISEIEGLGRHLISKSLDTFKDVVLTPELLENLKKEGREGTLHISESHLRKESAALLMADLKEFMQKIHKISTREKKVYPKSELILFSQVLSFLPVQLYRESIPNL